MPFYVAPAALAGMVHPDGERGIAEACKRKGGVGMCVSFSRVFFLLGFLGGGVLLIFFWFLGSMDLERKRKTKEEMLG